MSEAVNGDLSKKMVQTHILTPIVPRGTQGWELWGKVGESKGEGSSGLEDKEELPLLRCIHPQGEAGQVSHGNLADRRAMKIREVGYKNSLSADRHWCGRSEC